MIKYHYCTPEWLEESAKIYRANLEAHKKLKKLSGKMVYRVKAEPACGIETDVFFCLFFNKGNLTRLEMISKEEGIKKAELVIGTTLQEWKKILRKDNKFITSFMLGKIILEKGSKLRLLSVAPYANDVVELLTAVDLVFPDELSTDELETYKDHMKTFRKELCV